MDRENKHKKEDWSEMIHQLREHQEPYKEGAWEAFEARYFGSAADQQKAVFPPMVSSTPVRRIGGTVRTLSKTWVASAAAVILMALGLLWLWPSNEHSGEEALLVGNSSEEPTNSTPSERKAVPSVREEVKSTATLALTNVTANKAVLNLANLENTDVISSDMAFEKASMNAFAIESPISSELSQPSIAPAIQYAGTTHASYVSQKSSEKENSLVNEIFGRFDRGGALASNSTGKSVLGNSKWAFGVSLASTMTSEDNVNLAGGLSLIYRLSDRVHLRSGFSVANLGVSSSSLGRKGPSLFVRSEDLQPLPGMPGSHSGSSQELTVITPEGVPGYYNRMLSGASSNILAIDVPLDVKYYVSDKIFASVGFSFLGVLRENRTNHYIDKINEPLFNGYTANGQELLGAVKTLVVNETSKYQPMEGNGYTGYLNLSIGRQTRISNRIILSIEPFYKIPIGSLQHQDMNMKNGGIRIVTGF